MRSKNQGLTPREEALLIIAGWIHAVTEGKTLDIFEVDDRDSFRVQVRSALIKEHNKLLDRVKEADDYMVDDEPYLPESVSSTDKYMRS